jgi:hypothetical protein
MEVYCAALLDTNVKAHYHAIGQILLLWKNVTKETNSFNITI